MRTPADDWADYYARTQDLPSADKYSPFLSRIPPNGAVLDFGTGTGRWAAAFHHDRPDLTIDLVDVNLAQATLIPSAWPGERYPLRFEDFVPARHYDGIWSFASLFFVSPPALPSVLARLAQALKPDGTFFFTMVEDGAFVQEAGFHGIGEAALRQLLQDAGLTVESLHKRMVPYCQSATLIPTLLVKAGPVA